MAPIKFEEQLKEKLEKRTIQPSTEAWDVLVNRLGDHHKKQQRKNFWWLGIAASIVGVALVTTLVFRDAGTETLNPKVVEIDNQMETNTDAVVSEQVEITTPQNDNTSKPERLPIKENRPVTKLANIQKDFAPEKAIISRNDVASSDVKVQNEAQKEAQNPVSTSDFEQAKVNAVVAEIQRINNENQGVSEAEIDSLLKQAEREILKNRIYAETTKTVDANVLLEDVEAELEQSFRTRVFQALLNNYETVKTAVAERNN